MRLLDIINGIRNYNTYTLEEMEPFRKSLTVYFDSFFCEPSYFIEVKEGQYTILPYSFDTKEELIYNFDIPEEEVESVMEKSIRL